MHKTSENAACHTLCNVRADVDGTSLRALRREAGFSFFLI